MFETKATILRTSNNNSDRFAGKNQVWPPLDKATNRQIL